MTEDKILAYLNLKKEQKIDKTLMKIVFWFDFSFSTTIMLFELLWQDFKIEFLDYIYMVTSIALVVIFAILCKKSINPSAEITYSGFVLFASTVKIFYAYLRFSEVELIIDGYPKFSLFHLIALVACLLIALYICWRFFQIFCGLKLHTIEQARKNIEKKQPRFLWIPVFIGLPMIVVRIIKDDLLAMRLGIGFYFWVLDCLWLCLCLMLLPKYVVVKRYKVANIFSKERKR